MTLTPLTPLTPLKSLKSLKSLLIGAAAMVAAPASATLQATYTLVTGSPEQTVKRGGEIGSSEGALSFTNIQSAGL